MRDLKKQTVIHYDSGGSDRAVKYDGGGGGGSSSVTKIHWGHRRNTEEAMDRVLPEFLMTSRGWNLEYAVKGRRTEGRERETGKGGREEENEGKRRRKEGQGRKSATRREEGIDG